MEAISLDELQAPPILCASTPLPQTVLGGDDDDAILNADISLVQCILQHNKNSDLGGAINAIRFCPTELKIACAVDKLVLLWKLGTDVRGATWDFFGTCKSSTSGNFLFIPFLFSYH